MLLISAAAWCVALSGIGTAAAETSPSKSGAPSSASELFSRYAKMPGFEARFKEVKTIALLSAPISNTGVLYYLAPDTLRRDVHSPTASSIVIGKDRIASIQNGKSEIIQLQNHPEVLPFVRSMVWLLSGNEAALEKNFRVRFGSGPSARRWRMTLHPLHAPINQLIETLTVRGQGWAISEITVKERSGDTSVTTVTDVDPARRFTPEEKKKLFQDSKP